MTKPELVDSLQEQYRRWEALLAEIGPARMEQPGVNGDWSMKDLIAHLTGWQPPLIDGLQAAQRGEPEPPPPWPAHLETEDEINTWIYERNRGRSLCQVLDESQQAFLELLAAIESLPDDIEVEPEWRLVTLNGRRFSVSEFFDHFRLTALSASSIS